MIIWHSWILGTPIFYPVVLKLGFEGRATLLDKFVIDKFRSEPFENLMKRIRIEHEPRMDVDFPSRWPAEATVKTRDGQLFSHAVDLPRGEPEWLRASYRSSFLGEWLISLRKSIPRSWNNS